MYNRRVSKADARVEAYGCIDELNAALGMARATADTHFIKENLLKIQQQLVVLMGELATLPTDLERYAKDGFEVVTPAMVNPLEQLIMEIEAQKVSFKGWATPGSSQHSAALDLARTICRRGERAACALSEAGELKNVQITIYLNRLSDLLWLMARWVETRLGSGQ
jgi:cob(I)alamin adenosyltransferase